MLLIVTEKPDAMKNFAKALGGTKGTFDGQEFELIALAGHTLKFKDPHEMVSDDKVVQYKSWNPEHMPWDLGDFSWSRRPQKGKADLIRNLKDASKRADALVIATDVDPSGEGELIAMEAFKAIGWRGPIKRMYFVDESVKQVQTAFKTMRDVSNPSKNGDYLKAEARARWDFVSMQITRVATTVAKGLGLDVTLRNGRLKSVMTRLVFMQEELIRKYKRVPYYEVQFKDDNGHVYKRKFQEGDTHRFASKEDVPLASFYESNVVETGRKRKKTAPRKLLDLMELAAILAPKGYSSKKVLDVYQKMYLDGVVSYPRTEDVVISVEQFNEMLPLVDDIASVVGVDSVLLTHRSARKTHVADGGAHGANRPGKVVPKSLEWLSKYDNGSAGIAAAIYETLARNFLSMFGEDYEYDSVSGQVVEYPEYKTSFSIPVKQGWKAIFNDIDEDEDDDVVEKGLGSKAVPSIGEGANPKPATPTIKWLKKQLEKYDVGTGATRTSTLSEITGDDEKRRLMNESKGKLSMTLVGKINAVLLKDTWIANPEITQELFGKMDAVGNFQMGVNEVVASATKLVTHDKGVILQNEGLAQKYLESVLKGGGKDAKSFEKLKAKAPAEKITRLYKGVEITFTNLLFGQKPATEEELEKALSGEEFVTTLIGSKSKKPFKARVGFGPDLEYGYSFKFLGAVQEGPAKVKGVYKGQEIEVRPKFGSYLLSDDEMARLFAGESFTIKTKTNAGKDWSPMLILENHPKYGWSVSVKPSESKKSGPATSISDMKDEFSGHKFSDAEKEMLLKGGSLQMSMKGGKKAFVKYGLTEFKGRKYYGYYVDEWV